MGYYDSVKDDIKNNESKNSNSGGFDTLKESAEQNTKPDEQKGDDTPIEVVGEDRIETPDPGKDNSGEGNKNSGSKNSSGENPFTEKQTESESLEELGDKLETIIQQNQKMIEILESFGQ
jgi:hypothetical protein